MKIKVTQEKLNKALTNISRVAVSKSTLPILNNVLIKVKDKKVSLITTNLDMAVIDYLPVSESEEGEITVPAKLLSEFISNLPKGELIELTEKNLKLNIKSGKYSSTINGISSEDFPEIPEIDEKLSTIFKIEINEFKKSVNQVIIASSNDLTRPALTGVYFNTYDDILAIAATDGYRLAEKKMLNKIKEEIKAIIPSSTLQEVLRSIDEDKEEIEISFSNDLVRFRLGEIEIISKLIDASFPEYQKLIPEKNNISIILDKDELIRVTKLAALFSRSIGGSITCQSTAPNSFLVKSISNEYGENDSEIEAKVNKDGKVNLNSRFLLDALNSIDQKQILFEFSDHVAPIMLKGNNDKKYIHIVMPLNS